MCMVSSHETESFWVIFRGVFFFSFTQDLLYDSLIPVIIASSFGGGDDDHDDDDRGGDTST